MCQSPSHVWVKRGPEWEQVPVPCDDCWSCRENYVSDWVGRCLCEASVSEVSCTVSLTNANPRDPLDLSNWVVNPHHFQLFMKRLRKAGHKVRYLVAGEYGDLRDRAHFHAILFFKLLKPSGKPAPYLMDRKAFLDDPSKALPFSREIPQEEMVHISEWPHGHIQVDWSCTDRSIRYCCEYLNPQAGKKTGWFSMSKKPALGFEWFAAKAERNREFGVLPSSFEYLPPGGKPGKVYLMTGATRRDYMNMITTDRSERPRMSKWVRATFDKLERQAFAEAADGSVWWPDDHFAERERETERIEAARARKEYWQEKRREYISEYGIGSVIVFTSARVKPDSDNGRSGRRVYEDEAEYDEAVACAARQAEGSAELFPSRGSEAKARRRAAAPARKAPTRFSREGKPLWGEEGRDYLPAAFARPERGAEGGEPDDAGGDLQADPSDI